MIPNTTAGSPVKYERRIEQNPSNRLTLANSLSTYRSLAADALFSRCAGVFFGVLARAGGSNGCPKSAAASSRLLAKSSASATTSGMLISSPQPAFLQRKFVPAAFSEMRYFAPQPGHRTSIGIEMFREFGQSTAPKRSVIKHATRTRKQASSGDASKSVTAEKRWGHLVSAAFEAADVSMMASGLGAGNRRRANGLPHRQKIEPCPSVIPCTQTRLGVRWRQAVSNSREESSRQQLMPRHVQCANPRCRHRFPLPPAAGGTEAWFARNVEWPIGRLARQRRSPHKGRQQLFWNNRPSQVSPHK